MAIFIGGAIFAVHLFNFYFPLKYTDIIEKHAASYNLDPVLVASIINVESRFRHGAVSHAGASGLMQLMPGTANWVAQEVGIADFYFNDMIFEPHINIQLGSWYLRRLIDNHSTLPVALAAYNAGSGNVASWLDNPDFSSNGTTLDYIPFGETRRYVDRVQLNIHAYRFRFWLTRIL